MKTYDLTNPQESIWQMEQYYNGTNINNICGTVTLKQDVDLDILNKAINIFVKNNESFSLNFKEENGKLVQFFTEPEYVEFERVTLKDYSEAKSLAEKSSEKPFNIYGNRLYNFILYKFENGNGGFVVLTHHIISDGATLAMVGTEIPENYRKLISGEEIEKKGCSYEEYIKSEKEYMNSPKFKKDEAYWNNLYSDIPEIASIPSSKTNNNLDFNATAKRKGFSVGNRLCNKISKFCEKYHVSNFNFFMAIYAIYLGKISNLNDFVIGTPILNRANFKEKRTSGMFINTAPLRIKLDNEKNFVDFTKQIAIDSLGMLRYQKYPYQMLLQNLRKKEANLPGLFDVMLSFQITSAHDKNIEIPYDVEWLGTSTISDGLSIHFHYTNGEDNLNIDYDYQTGKYDEKDIDSMHSRILHVIKQVLENEEIIEKDIEIVTPEEKDRILNEFNDTFLEYDKDKTIIDYFEEQAQKTPDNVAVVFEDKKLTYSELNRHANSLAHYLRSNGVKSNSIIGVMASRSLEMIVSLLAVLKAGGSYIPIDPEYPKERVSFMLSQSKSTILISQKHLENKIREMEFNGQIVYSDLTQDHIYSLNDGNLDKISKPSDLSYIIYTSGSTGIPKGVMLTHGTLSNFIASMFNKIDYLHDGIPHSIVSITTVSFDIFAFETLTSLCFGLKLFITNDIEQKNTSYLEKLLKNNHIEIIQSTPSVIKFHLENSTSNGFASLKYIMLAGEQLSTQLVTKIKEICPNCTIYDGYGPSETTIFSAVYDVTNLDYVRIGKPIDNTYFYIFNNDLNLLPENTIGEIYISGDGVGLGYLDRDDLTKKSYIPDPFKAGNIMYKSGDLGMWTSSGLLECKGRADHQVKLRGLRVELGEIEECINSFNISANIKSAVIVKEINNRQSLNAFIASNIPIDKNDLKSFLSSKLPQYMLPNNYTFLDKLPFTPNGKIDRKALLQYKIDLHKEIIAPDNDVSKYLVSELENILEINDISMNDSFFEIGGDSLIAIKLCIKISDKYNIDFTIQDIFDAPIIRDITNKIISKSSRADSNILKRINIKEYYNLSSAQKRIYYSSKIAGEENTLYNVPGALIFDKKPDVKKINECLQKLIKKHSSLRTYFEEIDSDIYQKIAPSISFELEEKDAENTSIDEIMGDFVKPFDLAKAPLFRMCLVKNKDKYLLLLDMHHIICDGTSISIFTKELSDLYNGKDISDLNFEYIDYAEWEFEALKSGKLNKNKEYWVNNFKNDIPLLDLPTDFVRPSFQSFEGAKIYKNIDKAFTDKIFDLAKNLNVSPFMVMLSAYYILLYKYSSSEDIIVGTPSVGRNQSELFNMIGMFVNTLPLKNHIEAKMSFKDFLNSVKANCVEAFNNSIYPFDELLNNLKITRDTSRNPLFDTMFIYQSEGQFNINFDGINSSVYIPDTNISKFDLSLEIVPNNNGELDLNFEYCTKLFKKETIERLSTHFINIVEKIIDNSETSIENIDILSEEEKHKILYEFNNTKKEYPSEKTIIELFEEQVQKTPDNVALVFDDKKLTYKELHNKVNSLALYLQKQNVKHGDIVCMLFDKSFEMIVSILSVLKLGACYLPIDITYPKDRIDYIIEDSKSKIVLSTKNISCDLPSSISTLHVDLDNSEIYDVSASSVNVPYFSSEDIAYIMYTSGSTGRPKGVMVKNINVVRLVENTNFIKFSEHERILQTGSIVFDACTFEIWAALLHGFELYIIKKSELLDVTIFEKYLLKNKITILWLTAPLFNQLCESNPSMFSNVKYLLTGGDVLSPRHINMVRKENPNLTIINGYGPTENTTFSTCFTIDKTYEKTIPIGSPIANSTAYVVSSNGSLLPIGFSGELWVGGDGVSAGYFNNPDLTNEKFIQNPFGPGMVYKTGDLVKWLPDGNIDFIGRIDNQVKIRGFRVELNEINNIFSNFNNIKECTTIIRDVQNKKIICSYFTSKDGSEININTIKSYLKEYLPSYMIPTYIYQLDKMPLTVNGKIDKKALPEINVENKQKYQKDNSNINILSEEEKHKILYEFNNTKRDYPRDKTLIELFEEQVQKTPDNIAVVFEDKKLTYRELDEKANAIAKELISNHIQYRDIVPVLLPRSIELIISIWGILKCGATYMPIYVDYPNDRINYMTKNSNAKIVLTNSDFKNKPTNIPSILIDDFNNINSIKSLKHVSPKPNDIAYIIYTSGSTRKA